MAKYIIGLHGYTGNIVHAGIHDASYAVADLETKELVNLVEIEKITGIKHDGQLNKQVLEKDLLALASSDMEIARTHFSVLQEDAVPGKFPFLKNIDGNNFKNSIHGTVSYSSLFNRKVPDYLYIHELAHVFTAFMYRQAEHEKFLGLVVEGCGSFAQSSLFLVEGDRIEFLEYNLPLLSGNFFQQWLPKIIFDIENDNYAARNATPGKVMALAAYGKPERFYDILLESFKMKVRCREYFNYRDKFCPGIENQYFSWKDRVDICASAQKLFEDLVVEQAAIIREKYGHLPLYYSGGCALSIKVNSQLKEMFSDLVIPPNCSDIGQSLGLVALHAFMKYHVRLKPLTYNTGLISKSHEQINISGRLSKENIGKVADILAKGHCLAFVQGSPEIGPRALCKRSILASPQNYETREVFNYMKSREYFRPVAPIVLDSYGEKIFSGYHFSPFMLFDFPVKANMKDIIPACVHVDQTARVQSIPDDGSDISQILKSFSARTGLPPLLMNTSLNSRGKPIAASKEQVLSEMKLMKMKYLVLGDQLIEI